MKQAIEKMMSVAAPVVAFSSNAPAAGQLDPTVEGLKKADEEGKQ